MMSHGSAARLYFPKDVVNSSFSLLPVSSHRGAVPPSHCELRGASCWQRGFTFCRGSRPRPARPRCSILESRPLFPVGGRCAFFFFDRSR